MVRHAQLCHGPLGPPQPELLFDLHVGDALLEKLEQASCAHRNAGRTTQRPCQPASPPQADAGWTSKTTCLQRPRDTERLQRVVWLLFCCVLIASLALFFSFSISSLPPICLHTGCRGHFFTSACVLACAPCRWTRLASHRHTRPHSVGSSCSYAHVGLVSTASASSPRDLARPCSRTRSSLSRPKPGRKMFPYLGMFATRIWATNYGENFPVKNCCHWFVFRCVFHSPPSVDVESSSFVFFRFLMCSESEGRASRRNRQPSKVLVRRPAKGRERTKAKLRHLLPTFNRNERRPSLLKNSTTKKTTQLVVSSRYLCFLSPSTALSFLSQHFLGRRLKKKLQQWTTDHTPEKLQKSSAYNTSNEK